MFYTDNQGPWNGACGLKHLAVGGFVGHPDSFKWYNEPEAKYLGLAPQVPKSGSRMMVEAKKIPQLDADLRHVPLRQDGPVGQRHRLRPLRRQVRPVREAALRRRPDAQHRHARLPGEGERPLPGGLLPVPPGLRLAASSRSASPRTARCSSAAPTAAGARAAPSRSPSSASSGPARSRSRSTRCGPSPTASS